MEIARRHAASVGCRNLQAAELEQNGDGSPQDPAEVG
jgi:hypothetical protein